MTIMRTQMQQDTMMMKEKQLMMKKKWEMA
jgi:hypothetical protein